MTHEIVGRKGRMDGAKVIDTDIRVKLEEDDVIGYGHGPTEEEALEDARREIERFKNEQALINTPAVVAAREVLAEAIRIAREG